MKKSLLLIGSAFFAFAVTLTSCDPEEVTPPVQTTKSACDSAVYPTTSGDAIVKVLNYPSMAATVAAGSELSLAVEITKGTNRAQKIRLYQSDCINSQGSEVDLSDQDKGGKNGIDLRRTDEAQVRNVTYKVPASGFSTIYLTIQVDEATGKSTYKQMTLTVNGSGVISTWSDISLGGNSNALASRMSSGTGLTYLACNAAANIEYIDITYAVATAAPYTSYLTSNPARFLAPLSLSVSSASCGDDGSLPTNGGTMTHFAATTLGFDAATNSDLTALTVSATDPEYIAVTAAGNVFAFVNAAGQKGLVKVVSVNKINDATGSIVVSVKVQR